MIICDLDNCIIDEGTEFIIKCKKLVKLYFDHPDDNSLARAFLDPLIRNLLMILDINLYNQAKKNIEGYALDLYPEADNNSIENSNSMLSDDEVQENIIHKMQWDVEGIKSISKDCTKEVKLEIQKYITKPMPAEWKIYLPTTVTSSSVFVAAKNCNPMLFWKKNHGDLPILSRVARYFLISPRGTATQERFFSVMKMNRTSKRIK